MTTQTHGISRKPVPPRRHPERAQPGTTPQYATTMAFIAHPTSAQHAIDQVAVRDRTRTALKQAAPDAAVPPPRTAEGFDTMRNWHPELPAPRHWQHADDNPLCIHLKSASSPAPPPIWTPPSSLQPVRRDSAIGTPSQLPFIAYPATISLENSNVSAPQLTPEIGALPPALLTPATRAPMEDAPSSSTTNSQATKNSQASTVRIPQVQQVRWSVDRGRDGQTRRSVVASCGERLGIVNDTTFTPRAEDVVPPQTSPGPLWTETPSIADARSEATLEASKCRDGERSAVWSCLSRAAGKAVREGKSVYRRLRYEATHTCRGGLQADFGVC